MAPGAGPGMMTNAAQIQIQAETDAPRDLLGMGTTELEAVVVAAGLPKFRARQLWRWVWRHGLTRSRR